MRFSKAELGVLDQVSRGNRKVENIAQALNKGQRRIYDAIQLLKAKGFVTLAKGFVQPKEGLHITLLLQALAKTPNMPKTLANGKLPLLTAILEPATIKKIEQRTGLKKSMIYTYMKELKRRNLIRTDKDKQMINHKIWPELAKALRELKRFEDYTDPRVPVSSIIYKKTSKEIVFSCKENMDATPTAFSAYERHGIKLLLLKNYYTLPKRALTREDIMMHSLYVAETDCDTRLLIFIALFYAKYKKRFSRIHHIFLKNIDKILKREKVKGYPTYEEIKDRAQVYNISI